MTTKKLPRRPGKLPPPTSKLGKRPAEPGSRPRPPRPGTSGRTPPPRSRPARVHKSKGAGAAWLKKLFLVVAVLMVLGGGGLGFLYYQLERSLPQVEGMAQLSGLTAPVEVLRDANGVPHLFGADIRDLARAMGYVQAQDRFFQMELGRRLGSGRLAEIFGSEAVDTDRRARRLGLAQAAASEVERMSPEAREVLEAYASGVNAYLAAHRGRLPPELRILGVAPARWEVADSLAIAKWMSYILSYNGEIEMLRHNLAASVGLEDAYRLTGLAPPPPAPESARTGRELVRIAALEARSNAWFRPIPGASNAWAVSGDKSSTGRPILASDPHLSLSMPSVWYEVHLSGGGYEVAGASLPGLPMIVIGQNRRIAWGATALFADVQDLYLETRHPENPRQYLTVEGAAELDVIRETIQVKDQSPVVEEVLVSRHGVIVGETEDGNLLAQRWDGLWTGDHVRAALELNRAGSWQEFTEALRSWSSPALAFLYADLEGNIGFFPAGDIPVRTGHDGTIPADGASGTEEWQGTIPHELKPMIFNPEEGFLVSANQPMLPPETPYPLGADTLATFRASRIRDLLKAVPRSSLDDFARFQGDRYDLSTESVLRYAVALRPTEAMSVQAVEKLRGWNGQMTGGPAPAIYQALYRHLIENTFRDEMGDGLFQEFLRFLELGHPGGIYAVLDDESSPFWDDRETPETESRDRILLASLEEAVRDLAARQGDDVNAWDWGDLHAVRFLHPLGVQEPMSTLFNRGPVAFGGSTFTVANAVVSLQEPYATLAGTSYRLRADPSNPEASRSGIPTGASGHPLSPHYFDQSSAWREARGHPLLLDRSALENTGASKLILQP